MQSHPEGTGRRSETTTICVHRTSTTSLKHFRLALTILSSQLHKLYLSRRISLRIATNYLCGSCQERHFTRTPAGWSTISTTLHRINTPLLNNEAHSRLTTAFYSSPQVTLACKQETASIHKMEQHAQPPR